MVREPDPHWYVIMALPNMDVRFASDLASRGYETFVPWTFQRVKVGNEAWVKTDLRLPPYVWVCIDETLDQDFETVRQTLGFGTAVSLRIDRNGERNASEVPYSSIRGMRRDQMEDFEAAVRRVRRKESFYHQGETIKVIALDNLFCGYTGIVDSARYGSLVALIGPNKVPVHFEDEEVASVSSFQTRKAAGA